MRIAIQNTTDNGFIREWQQEREKERLRLTNALPRLDRIIRPVHRRAMPDRRLVRQSLLDAGLAWTTNTSHLNRKMFVVMDMR